MPGQHDGVAASMQPTKVWNTVFVRIFIANTVMQMGQFMMNTLIPKYAKVLGANDGMVGLVSSMFAITALGMRVVSGPATLSYDKKKIVAIASLGIAAAFCLYAVSASVPMVMAARLLHGCGMSFTGGTALALASDALPREKLGAGIGIFSLGQAVATALGPGIGLSLIGVIGYRTTFLIGAVVVAASAVMMYTIKVDDVSAKRPFRITLDTIIAKEALVPMTIILFMTMANSNINAFLVLFAESRGIENIGLFFTVNAVAMLVGRPVVSALSDRFGARRILYPALVCFALSMVTIGLARTLPTILLAAVLTAIGFGSCQPAIQTLCIKSVSPQRRGIGGSTNYVGLDIGSLIGPLAAGLVAERFGYAAMFFSLTIPIGIAVVALSIFYRRIEAIEAPERTADAHGMPQAAMEAASGEG
jgi:MFS family permease